jgi:hypothetical protein
MYKKVVRLKFRLHIGCKGEDRGYMGFNEIAIN